LFYIQTAFRAVYPGFASLPGTGNLCFQFTYPKTNWLYLQAAPESPLNLPDKKPPKSQKHCLKCRCKMTSQSPFYMTLITF
jgi:hypothetical protein